MPGLHTIGMTSNGIVLARKLKDLRASGLNALNLSLDTLKPERFAEMTRRAGLQRVLDSIDAAVDAGFDPVKLNVVLMRGVNDDEIGDFVALTRDRPINVRFIEYMPFDGNVWSDNKMVPYAEIKPLVEAAVQKLTGGVGAQLARMADPRGEVGSRLVLES
ncbi:hypothetical protein FOA52_006548 [Chlamydomonas sp. UWO 241]|nr:hypothetical protein FOA52_006548 [Chlamydomonas sp. UWO 241]